MANSKGDPKARKVMDVSQPGKTPPPATARPIIVTNRPILRRDPMMAASNDTAPDMDKPAEEPKLPVSRVAKTIKIMPLSADDDAPAESVKVETPAKTAPTVEALIAAKTEKASAPDTSTADQESAEHTAHAAPDKAVALEVGQEALASMEQPTDVAPADEAPADTADGLTIEPSVEPEQVKAPHPAATDAAPFVPEVPTPAADTSEAKPPADEAPEAPKTGDDANANASPKEQTEPPETADATPPAKDEADASADEAPAESAAPSPEAPADGAEVETEEAEQVTDGQLAPNQIHADEKRKLEQATLERNAELEKIIDSKQYFLPIAAHEKKRGAMRSVVVLIVVALLAVAWLDVVLDAGIVHIPGVQAPTHFFRK